MFIKICGIKSFSEVDWCIEAGVDAFGFIVEATHETPDEINILEAKRLTMYTKDKIKPVMVTHTEVISTIVSLCKLISPWGVQIQGDLEKEKLLAFRIACPKVKLIKTVHVMGVNAIKQAKKIARYVDYILLDTRTPTQLGGTGKTHDWNISKKIVESVKVPVILAGGLNPENVEKAIQTVTPFGVDVNTGTKGDNGRKSKEKIISFAQNARRTFCRLGSY